MIVAKSLPMLTDYVFDYFLNSIEHSALQVELKTICFVVILILLQNSELTNLIKMLLKLTHMSNRHLSIINTSLLKMYPNFVHSRLITIDELQQWDLWPKVLALFGMYVS